MHWFMVMLFLNKYNKKKWEGWDRLDVDMRLIFNTMSGQNNLIRARERVGPHLYNGGGISAQCWADNLHTISVVCQVVFATDTLDGLPEQPMHPLARQTYNNTVLKLSSNDILKGKVNP